MLFGTPFGFCFFSTLHAKSSIRAHSDPMNLRLRMHLPLVVPKSGRGETSSSPLPSGDDDDARLSNSPRRPTAGIRVADQVREWREGLAVVLDDSYVHEAWNDSEDGVRVVLLTDLWHPDVRAEERGRISNMFDYARDRGWIGGAGG